MAPGRILAKIMALSGKPADICMSQVRRMAGRSKLGEMPPRSAASPASTPAARRLFTTRAPRLNASAAPSPASTGTLRRSAGRTWPVYSHARPNSGTM